MRIYSLELENFRLFEKKRIDFPEGSLFSVLIGENGSGKTSILLAIADLFREGYLKGINSAYEDFENQSFRHWDSFRKRSDAFGSIEALPTFKVTVQMVLPEGSSAEVVYFGDSETPKGFVDSKQYFFSTSKQLLNLRQSYKTKIANEESITLPVLAYLPVPRTLKFLSKDMKFVPSGSRMENGYHMALEGEPNNFRRFLEWYMTFEDEARKFPEVRYYREQLDLVSETIVKAMEMFNWESFHFSHDRGGFRVQRINENGERVVELLKDLSEGFQSVLSIVGTIAWRCVRLNAHLGANAILETPGIVLIDELDLHLHPTWQRRIVSDLKRAFPKIQFICTTHSPFIVQSLTAEEVIDLDGQIDYNPKDLALEEVAQMMGVDSSFSIQNEEDAATAEKYLKTVRGIGNEEVVYRGVPETKEEVLDELEAKMTNPAMRALLKLERLKYRG